MARPALCALALALLVGLAAADIYMHNPRGSNNRLDGNGQAVDNEQRLFDSQNNAQGGYNQGYMYFYSGSVLTLEWTNQHGAGLNPNVNSELIVQYLCDDVAPGIRDGTQQTTITLARADDYTLGRQESAASYAKCSVRQRNQGLFTADQALGTTTRSTRQNAAGTQHGFECPEERDYYPYWHPSEWRDAVVLTSNLSRCAYYQAESQNVKPKGHCELTDAQQQKYDAAAAQYGPGANFSALGLVQPVQAWVFNNPADCGAAGFQWLQDGAFGLAPPYCGPLPTTRDNHLGNALNPGVGRGAYASQFNWTLPQLGNQQALRCVLRMRYNVSTGDYDGWATNASANRVVFPQQGNPQVLVYSGGAFNVTLQLQVDTSQYGRTFQDRSHAFDLLPAVTGCPGTVYNLNVRGKRGNIVQVYPAVEYDFVPERLHIGTGDCIHLQWTGSNTNPPNNAGEGVAGSDRSNWVQMYNASSNYPANYSDNTMVPPQGLYGLTRLQTTRRLATLLAPNNQAQINDAAPYFDAGVFQVQSGTNFYMSTRNNNFSNRSQKGVLIVGDSSSGLNGAIIAGIVIFSAICFVGLVVAWGVLGTRNPDSVLGASWAATRDFFTGFVDH